MPIIKIYPSTLPGQPIETIDASGTVGQFLAAKYPAYKPGEVQPLILKIDGVEIPFEQWHDAVITDNTCLYFHPQGVYPEMINFKSAISKVFDFAFGWMIPEMPKVGKGAGTGASLKIANATANQPRLGGVIPDQAGLFRRAPDYLLPPHRYFVNDNEQWVRMLLCVGRGYYDIQQSGIKIGGTEIANFGADASYTAYDPGASLASDLAAEWWHTVPEVGGTSNGSAGLHIKSLESIPQYPTSSSFIFDGLTVSIPAGSGEFPATWTAGMIVVIAPVRDYTVDLGSGIRAVIRAELDQDFNDLQPYVGMPISIAYGPNQGNYIINNYSPRSGATKAQIRLNYPNGDPVYALETGFQKMAIGHKLFQYELLTVSSSAITVDRVYEDMTVDSGWPGFDYLESTLSQVFLTWESSLGTWVGPYAACPEGQTTDTLEVDILFPNGIARVRDNGAPGGWTVNLEIEYRDIALAGAWTTVSKAYTYETFDQLGFTETINLAYEIRPEVRVRRLSVEATQGYVERAEWYALKSKLTAPTSYAGVTTMTVELQAGDRLAALTENQITVECTRKLPELNGTTWTANTPTRSIAAYMAYVAKDIGYVDAQLDLVALEALDTIWTGRGDFYDWVHDASTVRDTINQVLQAGFSQMTIAGGKITPVRDATRTTLEQMYTPQNMTEPMRRSVSAVRPDDIDGVDVDYMDATTWTRQTVECRLPGDAGVQVQTVSINGVTSRTRAWRIGMRLRREAKYRRWKYEFSTELDGLVSNYLSYCYVADDVPGYAKSCLVTGADTVSGGVMLTVTEPITEFSSNTIVALRDEDGTINGPYIAEAGATDFEVKAVGLAVAPVFDLAQEPTHALIGDSTRYAFEVLITEIKPNGFDSVDLVAVNYDSRVYDDDNNAP